METPRFTTKFSLSAHVYKPPQNEEGEISASVNRLKDLFPLDIDPSDHPTILYIVGNLFVPGTVNKNDDAVSIENGLKMYKAFEGQQINIEHSRGSIVGYIVKAGLSEFGTDRILSEEEVIDANKPYNVAVVIAIWRVADRDLVQYIVESAESDSLTKNDLSLSFEVGFNSYSIVILPKGANNLALVEEKIEEGSDKFKSYDKTLKLRGGSGVLANKKVARELDWPIIPLGGGIVATPAAAVKGLAVILPEEEEIEEEEIEEEDNDSEVEAKTGIKYEYSSTQCTLSAEDALPFLGYASTIAEEDVYYGEEGAASKYGRETETHVTVKYGIKSNDIEPIQKVLEGCGPIKATLGKVSAFQNVDKPYDVIKVDVISDDLCALNALIEQSCDHDKTFPVYFPHLTICYVKKGVAYKYIGYAGFEGKELIFNSVTWSPAKGEKQEIYLGKNLCDSNSQVVNSQDTSIANNLCVSAERLTQSIKANVLSVLEQQAKIGGKLYAVKVDSSFNPTESDKHGFYTYLSTAILNLSTNKEKNTKESVSSFTTLSSINNNTMKLEDIKQAIASVKTVEDLPSVMANVATFADIIAKASEEHVKAKEAADKAKATAEATLAEVQAKLDLLSKSHNDLLAAQKAAAADATFQTRMAAVEEVFAFDDESRSDIVSEIKACETDESFTVWMTKAKRLYKGYLKAAFPPVDEKKKMEDEKKKEDDEACKAAAAKVAAEKALEVAKANVVSSDVTNHIETTTQSLKEKFKALASKNIRFGGESAGEITAKLDKRIKKTGTLSRNQ